MVDGMELRGGIVRDNEWMRSNGFIGRVLLGVSSNSVWKQIYMSISIGHQFWRTGKQWWAERRDPQFTHI